MTPVHLVNELSEYSKNPEYYDTYVQNLPRIVLTQDWTKVYGDLIDTVAADEVRLPFEVCKFFFVMHELQVSAIAKQLEGGKIIVVVKDAVLADGSTVDAADNIHGISQAMQPPRCLCGSKRGFGLLHSRCKRCSTPVIHGRPAGLVGFKHPPLLNCDAERHVKAACIAMDTGMADFLPNEAKAQHARLQAVKRDMVPLADDVFHVLDITKRVTTNHATEHQGGTKRLHMRRGHWRHYPDHVTWIKWMLVGNPEAGTVEKTYKL